MERETPLDAERILEELTRHDVDYVIIGGLAVQTHGHVRTTVDIDVYPSPDQLRARALELRLGELRLAVAGRDDLISMKRASARPVDLEDLAALIELGADNSSER